MTDIELDKWTENMDKGFARLVADGKVEDPADTYPNGPIQEFDDPMDDYVGFSSHAHEVSDTFTYRLTHTI